MPEGMSGFAPNSGDTVAMCEIKRFGLRLSLENVIQRQVWVLIQAIPKGKRTERICEMLLAWQEQEKLEDTIYKSVKRALHEEKITTKKEPEEIEENVLDFLASL